MRCSTEEKYRPWYSLSNQAAAVSCWYVSVILERDFHPEVIKANRPLRVRNKTAEEK